MFEVRPAPLFEGQRGARAAEGDVGRHSGQQAEDQAERMLRIRDAADEAGGAEDEPSHDPQRVLVAQRVASGGVAGLHPGEAEQAVDHARHPAEERTAELELHQGTRDLRQCHQSEQHARALEMLDLAAESIQPEHVEEQVQKSEVDQHGREESPRLAPVDAGEVEAVRADRHDEESPQDRRARVPETRQDTDGHAEDDQGQRRLPDRAAAREATALGETRDADRSPAGFSLLANPLGCGAARCRRRAGVAARQLRRGFEVRLVEDPDRVPLLVGAHLVLDAVQIELVRQALRLLRVVVAVEMPHAVTSRDEPSAAAAGTPRGPNDHWPGVSKRR